MGKASGAARPFVVSLRRKGGAVLASHNRTVPPGQGLDRAPAGWNHRNAHPVDNFVDSNRSERAKVQIEKAIRMWTSCSDVLRDRIPDATWRAWFSQLEPMTIQEGKLTLSAPSSLVKDRVEGRFFDLLQEAIAEVDQSMGVAIVVRTKDAEPDSVPEASNRVLSVLSGFDDLGTLPPSPMRSGTGSTEAAQIPLNPRYDFESFVIGASNRFAHAAALSVAETPARSYNPLFIHGDAGLGKTHLLHAIGNYVRQNFPNQYVRYVSTETFMNEFVEAIRTNTTGAFKRRYRECDVLLVDDIQFMEKKESLQEEFFHTFNSLYEASRQIVLTSDRPPRSIATLEDRLRSRFLSGLITDIQPPDLETRLAILRSKAESERADIPDQVFEFIASNVESNIRELEGALIRVCAFASLSRAPVSLELAEQVLSDLVSSESREITPEIILENTSAIFGFSVEELKGTSRRRPLVTARQVGMYVFRELTDLSYPAIAKEFGGRDHTTVMHAVEKISAQMKERRQVYDQVSDLLSRIRGGR